MNVERILALADVLERNEPPRPGMGFHFGSFYRERSDGCGSIACMAGWAFAMFCLHPEQSMDDWGAGAIMDQASEALGLSSNDAWDLFIADVAKGTPGIHSPLLADGADAARLLRHLAATGEVDWRKAFLTVPR